MDAITRVQIASANTKRDASIDAFRVIAFCAIVLIHGAAFKDPNPVSLGHAIVSLSSFAVPYFFIVAGYFSAKSIRTPRTALWRLFKRLVPLFIGWGLFYTLLFKGSLSDLLTPNGAAHFVYTGGAAYHLWFLPALGFGLAIYLLTKDRVTLRTQLGLAAVLYLFGYLFGPAHSAFHLPAAPLGVRNGPFVSYTFVLMGAVLASHPVRLSAQLSIVLFVGAAAVHLAEGFILHLMGGLPIDGVGYQLSTVPYALSAFLLATSFPSRLFGSLGLSALGYYLIHPLFLYLLQFGFPSENLRDRLIIALLTIVASIISVQLLNRFRWTRLLVN
jgi:surface polysaccharide O-acyltransferase-like enzyme